MILILSDAALLLKEKNSGEFVSAFTGFGYEVAKELSEKGIFPALFCTLGEDRAGAMIAEELIKSEILFDPDLIRLKANTNVVIEYANGDRTSFFKSSASALLQEEMLSEAINVHTNIEAVLLSSSILSVNPSATSAIDQSLFISPRPFIAVDLTDEAEGSVLERSLSMLSGEMDLVIMDEENLYPECLKEKCVVVKKKDGITLYKNGEEIKTYEIDSERFTSSFLFFLDQSGFLSDFEKKLSVDIFDAYVKGL